MKRVLAILLVLLLTLCAAQAEGMDELLRERKLIINGVEETVTETKYISMNGFSLWVDPEHFWPTNAFGGVTDEFVDVDAALGEAERMVTVLMVPAEVPHDQAEPFLGEAVALYPPENVTDAERVILPSGLEYYVRQAVEEGVVYRFYAVLAPEHLVCVTAGFPEAMAEEYTTRVNAMINSIEFAAN